MIIENHSVIVVWHGRCQDGHQTESGTAQPRFNESARVVED